MRGGSPWPAVRVRLLPAILFAAHVVAFVDRAQVAVADAAIMRDLALSGTKLGLLSGTAFAVLFCGIVTVTASGRRAGDGQQWRDERHPPILTIAIAFPPRSSAMLSGRTIVFSLSLRDVELLLAERGIVVSYETVRR